MTSQTWEGFTEVPVSLLESDYKVLPNFIAFQMEKVISKIIHADQTDFVKNRQAADNVRRLFHIIETSKTQEHPLVILSMDAGEVNLAFFLRL